MEEKELKTSMRTRILIAIIAVVMLGSIIAGYAAIIFSNSHTDDGLEIDATQSAEYLQAYEAAQTEFASATKSDYGKFSPHLSQVAEFDSSAAESGGLQTSNLLEGTGRELTEGDTDYLAFYVGWCPNGTIFDSTLDSDTDPTGFGTALNVSENSSLITGWTSGIVGTKLGGVRELTIPSEQAYGSSEQPCGANQPLKFLIMPVANDASIAELAQKVTTARNNYQIYSTYGMTYDELMKNSETN